MTEKQKKMRGYFGVGIYHPKREVNIGTLWRSAFIFGASFIFTIGRRYKRQGSDTTASFRHIPLWNFKTYKEFKEHIPYDCRLVCIEMDKKAVLLDKFVHPRRAIYLLGAEDHGLPPRILKDNIVVQIPTVKPISLNVSVSGSIILSHRLETK